LAEIRPISRNKAGTSFALFATRGDAADLAAMLRLVSVPPDRPTINLRILKEVSHVDAP